MNPTAIYSKSGKGVQEASGKTSLLKRPDRAVLSAIDGRATLADVAQKVGKTFDKDFEGLITQLDKDGFIREVSPGVAAKGAPAAKPAAGKPAGKPTAPMDEASDLDFSSLATPSTSRPAPSRAAPPPPRPAAPPPRPAAPPAAAAAQQSALAKAREEAEARAAAEKDKAKADVEAKMRAELEAKVRAEAEEKAKEAASSKGKADIEAKLRAEADAKVKAARDAAVKAAAEAKAKADAESKRVREEADRAKREADELKQRLEAERKAREAAEESGRRAAEEERKKLEAERRKLEEQARKAEEERAERKQREEEEAKARRAQREEEERKAEEERAERRKQREEEERREEEEAQARRAQAEERRRQQEAEEAAKETERSARQAASQAQAQAAKDAQPKPAKTDSFADGLMSDLAAFTQGGDETKPKEDDAERKKREKEEAKRREKEEEERREREEEEERERKKKAKEEARRKEKEEEERREREEEEEKDRKKKEKEEAKRREKEEEEAKERERKEKAEKEKAEKEKAKARKKDDGDIPISDDDLDSDDVKRDQRRLAKAAKASPKQKEVPRVQPPPVAGPSVRRGKPTSWGKPITMVLFVVLLGGLGAVHVMPVDIAQYERAAAEALGQPVRLSGGRLWLFEGSLQVRFENATVGESVRIASVRAYPTIGALSAPKKVFSRIDLVGLTLPQAALGDALFTKVRGDNFAVERIVVRQLNLTGPLTLPKDLEADLQFDSEGAVRSATVRGPDTLVAKLAPSQRGNIEFDVNAGGFTLPVAPELTLGSFGMKGVASRSGMQIEKWDGTLLNGNIAGTANVRWGNEWRIDGVFTMRGINAAVFAPALLSEGRGEGTAKFNLSGPDPAKLGISGRYDGNFTVAKGTLGSVDLSNALRTGGRQAAGRTPFNEMTGRATYNAGAVSLREINISAGNLNAGASLDVTERGAVTGRIVADVRAGSQTLRATVNLGGTVKDPQAR